MPTSAEDTDNSKDNEFSIYTGPAHEQTLADTCRSLPAATNKSEDADDQPKTIRIIVKPFITLGLDRSSTQ